MFEELSKENDMFRAAVIFFVLAIGMLFGRIGFVGLTPSIGKTLLTVFLVLSAVSFIGSLISEKPKKSIS